MGQADQNAKRRGQPLRMLGAALSLFACLTLPLQARELAIEATLSPTQVFVGETAVLDIRVDGANPEDRLTPTLPTLPGATFEWVGAAPRRERYSVNGRVRSFEGIQFRYRVTPTSPGTMLIGPISYAHKAKRATTPGPRLLVQPPTSPDLASISCTTEPLNPIVHQPFDLVTTVLVRKLPPPFSAESPVHPQAQPPHITLPLLSSPFDGLERPEAKSFIESFGAAPSAPAFHINDYQVDRSPFAGMGLNSPFGAQPVRIAFDVAMPSESNPNHVRYTLRVPMRATRTGTFPVPSAKLKGRVITRVDPRTGRPSETRIHTTSEPFTITVREPPTDGRPASYVGVAATNLAASAQLDTQTCTVGSPLKLTLTITGSDQPATIHTPRLADISSIGRSFRIYDDIVETATLKDGRSFTYTLRPVEAGTLEIPAIPVSYFDYVDEAYRTIYTDPLPVRAIPVTQLRSEDVVGEPPTSVKIDGGDDLLARSAPLIFPVPNTPDHIIIPHLHLSLLLIPPLAFLLLLGGRAVLNHLPRREAALRRAQAAHEARRILHDTAQTPEQRVVEAIRHFSSARFSLPAASATPSDIRQQLSSHLPQDVAAPLAACFEQAFNHGFDGRGGTVDENDLKRVAELIAHAQHTADTGGTQ